MKLRYKKFKRKYPKLYTRIQDEVHKFYQDLGVVVVTRYKALELSENVLRENEECNPPKLEAEYRAYIIEKDRGTHENNSTPF